MKRLYFLIPVVTFLVLTVMFYKFLFQGPPSELPSPLVGKTAPGIALPALDEKSPGFSHSELAQGKPVIVNFWASWCVPCRLEHPTLMALAKREGVTLYGVDYKEGIYGKTDGDARGFLEELGNPFSKINKDKEGLVSIDWGVTGVPETFVIDGKGVIRVHYAGPLNDDILRRLILPALK